MEIIGIDKMRPFLSYFSALPVIDTGVALMREVCGMSEGTDSALAVPFEALCEAVLLMHCRSKDKVKIPKSQIMFD